MYVCTYMIVCTYDPAYLCTPVHMDGCTYDRLYMVRCASRRRVYICDYLRSELHRIRPPLAPPRIYIFVHIPAPSYARRAATCTNVYLDQNRFATSGPN